MDGCIGTLLLRFLAGDEFGPERAECGRFNGSGLTINAGLLGWLELSSMGMRYSWLNFMVYRHISQHIYIYIYSHTHITLSHTHTTLMLSFALYPLLPISQYKPREAIAARWG